DQSPHFTTEETNETINKMKRKHEAHSVLQKLPHCQKAAREMLKASKNKYLEKRNKNKKQKTPTVSNTLTLGEEAEA
uniref:Uncharacterized protein n=1 Tax=Sus scrofa TaxID=9823 RepID=A0A8D1JMN2_PIG